MSRTPKRGKPPGFDYWGKRKYSGMAPGKGIKRISRRIQRADDKRKVLKEKNEAE
jgi:hypothetical protein